MSKIGQQLLQSEEGWKRYDDLDSIVKHTGTIKEAFSNYYMGTTSAIKDANGKFSFSFTGVGFRIIGDMSVYRNNDIKIKVDGVEESFNASMTSGAIDMICLYEKTGLNGAIEHNVEIYCPTATPSFNFYLDAIDIYKGNKMTIKNPSTNQHYSLSEKTLIPLPNASSKNMILHGIEAGKEIKLDEAFDKVQYIGELSTATQGANGKIVTQKLLEKPNKILKISEVRV